MSTFFPEKGVVIVTEDQPCFPAGLYKTEIPAAKARFHLRGAAVTGIITYYSI